MSFANVGKVWSRATFPAYLATLKRPTWARSVTIHHCAAPSLAQRPRGFEAGHLANLRSYYQGSLGWSRGPHFFTDEDEIHGLTPPTVPGIHAVSFNSSSIAFEMLGNYDVEDPKSGRGLAVCRTTARAAVDVLAWLGLEPSPKTILFHRFDPRTSKTCPGTKVSHDWFLQLVREEMGTPAPVAPERVAYDETVPLVDYVAKITGRKASDLAKILRRDGGLFYLGEQWIEGARYDAATKTTLAPKAEADEAAEILSRALPASEEKLPVVATMASRLGISYAAAAKRLRFVDGLFTWDGRILVGAVYDRATQTTVAPVVTLAALSPA